jgi:hypothetical protein
MEPRSNGNSSVVSSPVDEMLLAALERGDDSLETGRYLITFKEGAATKEASESLSARGMRIADARDFTDQAVVFEAAGDADAVVFPEINCAIVSGGVAEASGFSVESEIAADDPVESIDPEYFVFSAPSSRCRSARKMAHSLSTPAPDRLANLECRSQACSTPGSTGFPLKLDHSSIVPRKRQLRGSAMVHHQGMFAV